MAVRPFRKNQRVLAQINGAPFKVRIFADDGGPTITVRLAADSKREVDRALVEPDYSFGIDPSTQKRLVLVKIGTLPGSLAFIRVAGGRARQKIKVADRVEFREHAHGHWDTGRVDKIEAARVFITRL